MGNTNTYSLPYPELTDTPDVPRDIKALAEKTDAELLKKVDKVSGKSLSTNDFDNTYKGKLDKAPADINAELAKKANAPTYVVTTMLASAWSGNTYSFESDYPFAQYDIEVTHAPSITSEQFDAFNFAGMVGNNVANTVKAIGDVPQIDIPIMIKVVKK